MANPAAAGWDTEVERVAAELIAPNGSGTALMECAATAEPNYLSAMSYASWPQARQLLCPTQMQELACLWP